MHWINCNEYYIVQYSKVLLVLCKENPNLFAAAIKYLFQFSLMNKIESELHQNVTTSRKSYPNPKIIVFLITMFSHRETQ